MFWYGGGLMWWMAALMWVGTIVFVGLLIWGGYALISNATRRPGGQDRGADARRILDERLARGEIDAEEHRRLRELISSSATADTVGPGSSS